MKNLIVKRYFQARNVLMKSEKLFYTVIIFLILVVHEKKIGKLLYELKKIQNCNFSKNMYVQKYFLKYLNICRKN